MNIVDALVLGVIEGITEFLPISSTAHLMFAQNFLGIQITSFVTTFSIVIQLGAMMAVMHLARQAFLRDKTYITKTMIAMTPTIVMGILLYPIVKHIFLSHIMIPIIAMGVGGIILVLFERFWKNKNKEENKFITNKQAFIIGLFQVIAFIPGVSRSATTIIGGMASGLSRYSATLFAFIIAIPTMFAASVYDLSKSALEFSLPEWGLILIGFITAWIVAHIVVRWFLHFVQTTTLEIFGWYRIIFAIVGMLLLTR